MLVLQKNLETQPRLRSGLFIVQGDLRHIHGSDCCYGTNVSGLDQAHSGKPSMDLTHQSPGTSPPNGAAPYDAADDTVYCSPSCSGCVIAVNASEWSQFALGQLVALGTATFLLAMIVFVLSFFSVFE
jgi:hypothetical protein